MMWDDDGPVSQGKILTALLREQDDEAGRMLRSWSAVDLRALSRAANLLSVMADAIANRRLTT